MDQIMGKVGSLWFSNKANKELGTIGNEITSMQSSIEGGAKFGKMQKPLIELLKEYDMAIGLSPKDATNYEFDEDTHKLVVHIPSVCEVRYKDSSVLRFNTTVTGHLDKGMLTNVEGIKTKDMSKDKLSVTNDVTTSIVKVGWSSPRHYCKLFPSRKTVVSLLTVYIMGTVAAHVELEEMLLPLVIAVAYRVNHH
ncbi:hypothetical protein MKX01_034493 [Papaver californicum]|nr:hypothetical protein MKX01_034493 [Papaver californicum]